ncbi:TlpA family protein disulfide reductase [Niabella sp. CC-SYL272]|uniref:TlpA family protein disulfide reductase n=1 Tax=Niabella agricola TaxID=2891571 RepID=UPI001F314C21|nr:TlpA disulfide reductase family protein [Niabella agricola]MCF3110688.1 TlpA family protein disulfide reductase [Niabella agricola]
MKKRILIMTLVFFTGAVAAGQKIVIRGSVNLLSKSKTIKISGLPDAWIKPDGSFEVSGTVREPHVALIATDSSGASAIWLEAGVYTLECQEIRMNGIQAVLMRIPALTGPLDAMIYNDYQKATCSGFAGYKTDDEKKTANRTGQGERAFYYVDSIIKKYPGSRILPDIIRSTKHYSGYDGTKALIAKLSPAQLATEEIKRLMNGLQRNEAIGKESGFENFSMQTADGKIFKLSDVKNKKLILVDFWASDCGPCRITHPRLIELYKKYADRGLEIISVSLDSDREKWLKAINEDKIGQWVHVSDLKNWESPLAKKYAVSFIPFRFLLDANYKVLSHDDDGQIWVTPGTVEAEIKKRGL